VNKNQCCQNCCDPNKCEKCIEGQCQVCGGDPDEVCCDGVCTPKCEDEILDSINCHGTSYDCWRSCDAVGCEPISTTTVYENIDRKTCQGGCPGECPDWSSVLCYTEYDCVRLWFPPYPDYVCDWQTGFCNKPNEGLICFVCKQSSGGGRPQYGASRECQ